MYIKISEQNNPRFSKMFRRNIWVEIKLSIPIISQKHKHWATKCPSGQACIIPVHSCNCAIIIVGQRIARVYNHYAVCSSFIFFNSMHLLMGFIFWWFFSKDSDYGLSRIMQRSPHTHAYHTHFFVLSMIFMQIPTVSYLCSQLATGTKGLCKQLQQANRFHPLQKNH